MRDPSHDILFEPVQIGPVTAPNRFYQVPHCTGMGHRYPRSEARLRGIKAEGGWGVVSTQETEIHPSSDLTPANEGRLWSDADIPALQLVAESVQEHGSLAAIQLSHCGLHTANRYSRDIPLAPSSSPVAFDDPVQAREMDKSDIAEFRRWHVAAARRAKRAGFNIIYVYAGHDMTLLQHFLLERHNHRTDEYGGSLKNRLRLFREVLSDTKEAVGDTCAVAVRLAVEELLGAEGLRHDVEACEIVEALAEEPDLWDVNLSDWSNDSQTSRFAKEGYQEPYTKFVKSLTTKPVVGVGRYTSPDTMARLVKSGHLDLVGAARPSIADPFLPKKIEEGRPEDIRECIGCNICVSGDNTNVPMRCTQNPTIGEEWRRGWHPEVMPKTATEETCLVVGGGPAGLEAACALVKGGRKVILAEASQRWGGRVDRESRLPGLSEWGRVRDWRLGFLQRSNRAELYLESPLTAENILEFGLPHVVLATGASWRRDGVGRMHRSPLPFLQHASVLTPDDLMAEEGASKVADGRVVVFDDDRFYMGSLMAELAIRMANSVTFVTPAPVVAPWSDNTLEQERTQKRLIDLNVNIVPSSKVVGLDGDALTIECRYSGGRSTIACDRLISVTSRRPEDGLWKEMKDVEQDWPGAGIRTVTRIGDCLAPGLIAAAVYSGHKYARDQCGQADPKVLREDNDHAVISP